MKVRKIAVLRDFKFEKRDGVFGAVKYTQLFNLIEIDSLFCCCSFFYFLGALCNLFDGVLFAGYAGL